MMACLVFSHCFIQMNPSFLKQASLDSGSFDAQSFKCVMNLSNSIYFFWKSLFTGRLSGPQQTKLSSFAAGLSIQYTFLVQRSVDINVSSLKYTPYCLLLIRYPSPYFLEQSTEAKTCILCSYYFYFYRVCGTLISLYFCSISLLNTFRGEFIPSSCTLFPLPFELIFKFISIFFLAKSYAFNFSFDFTLIREGVASQDLLEVLKFGIVVKASTGINLGTSSLLKNGCSYIYFTVNLCLGSSTKIFLIKSLTYSGTFIF